MTDKLEPKYLARVAELEHLHPPAFRFLTRLQSAERPPGLWLSTATNAHLYKHRAFLMYIKLQGKRQEAASVVLSPAYNNMIMQDGEDRSSLVFPKLITKLVMAHRGFSAGWVRQKSDGELELKPNTPDAFFEDLIEALRGLELPSKAAADPR